MFKRTLAGPTALLLLAFFLSSAQAKEYAVIGDAGHWNSKTELTRDSIKAAGIFDLVMPGDNLYKGESYDKPWAPWRSEGFRFTVVAIGNHTAGYEAEVDYFKMPGEFFSVRPEPGVHFIVLNSDNERTVQAQATFLEQELIQTSDPVVFVVFHHPPVSVTGFHSWTEKRAFHEATTPILLKHRKKLTALLVGHDHIASWLNVAGLPVFVSGATHEVRRAQPIDATQRGLPVRTAYLSKRKPVWLKLNVDAAQAKSSFEFIRAEDQRLECQVTLTTGARMAPQCQNE